MSAGVIPGFLDVALRASLDVAPKGSRAAVAQGEGGLELEEGQLEAVALEEAVEPELEDVAKGSLSHIYTRT